ncbi:hypothetical protein AMS68_001097 [Peltaster fructicola]|uniref:Uncharacterized protein n=1 Tax=Peltaster fructicola TaxID=286661 RepID=A0A6H0XM54_9PEZI|nr:hypothetical protein AMS68_001097 [Peltaster fructicola]
MTLSILSFENSLSISADAAQNAIVESCHETVGNEGTATNMVETIQHRTRSLVNPANGRTIYAGVREFSAEDDHLVLSSFLTTALGLHDHKSEEPIPITVHAKQLQKGTYVKLRPLEAGYDPADWKALLEQHLRTNYTTLTNGEVLTVAAGRSSVQGQGEYKFLVDGFKPEADGICVVDTDLEVDIEALNEEQARETLKRIAEKLRTAPGTTSGSSPSGALDVFKSQQGQVLPGEYVDYELGAWDKTQAIVLEVETADDQFVDMFVSPLSSTQRARPRLGEHVFAELDDRPRKRVRLEPTNAALDNAEALYISVHAYASKASSADATPVQYTISAKHLNEETADKAQETEQHGDDEVRCGNCGQWVPKGRLVLHENFCLRNNILCPHGCGQVFQKRSPEYEAHWHCQYDTSFGNTTLGLAKHNDVFHPGQVLRCDVCTTQETFSSYTALAQHHTTNCPAKLILCRFCHLEVAQEGDPDVPSAEVLLSGMTQHELLDGARTTECHMCSKIVRLRDMDTHLKSHDLDRLSRPPPQPCRNSNCGRTLDTASRAGDTRAGTRIGQGPGNNIGLCNVCFGPLYVSMHDPENKALRRRIERRYLQQLVSGCGKAWCKNEYCKTGRTHLGLSSPTTTKDALPMIKTLVDSSILPSSGVALHFCVDESSQKRRTLAEMIAAEDGGVTGKSGYSFEWCLAALEAENGDLDAARQWLKYWAPTRREGR